MQYPGNPLPKWTFGCHSLQHHECRQGTAKEPHYEGTESGGEHVTCVSFTLCVCVCVCVYPGSYILCRHTYVCVYVRTYLQLFIVVSCVHVVADLKQRRLGSWEWQLDPFWTWSHSPLTPWISLDDCCIDPMHSHSYCTVWHSFVQFVMHGYCIAGCVDGNMSVQNCSMQQLYMYY